MCMSLLRRLSEKSFLVPNAPLKFVRRFRLKPKHLEKVFMNETKIKVRDS